MKEVNKITCHREHRGHRGIIFILFLLFSLTTNVYAADGIIAMIKERYRSIRDMKGVFVQRSKIKDMDREMKYRGDFYIKIPNKMFWKYEENEQQVYINNKKVIIYQKKQNQAIKKEFDERNFGNLPVVLLSGFKDIERDYDFIEKKGFVRLTPQILLTGIKYIDIYPASGNFPIERFIVVDKRKNEIEVIIKDVEINQDINDSLFIFRPPEGVNMIED